MSAAIGKFCGSYSTLRPVTLLFFPFPRALFTPERVKILLTSFFRFFLYVTDPRFFAVDLWSVHEAHGPYINGKELDP